MAELTSPSEAYARLWASGSSPDLDMFLADREGIGPTELSAVIRIDQAQRWRRGERRPVEEYLHRYPALQEDGESVVDLIYHEFLLQEELDEAPSTEEFVARFPQYAGAVAEQIGFHRALVQKPQDLSDTMPTELDTASARPPASPLLPRLPAEFGRYRVLKLLGRGGMGTVYLAEDSQLGRQVALKLPRLDRDVSPEALERFRREARIAATFHHPNLCPVYDFGEIDGTLFLTMPYVHGEPLSARLREGPLSERDATNLTLKIARAVAVAHRAGVVHRDLKPSNVLLQEGGEPVVVDFGLARRDLDLDPKLTASGAVLGTPAYMPPEQVCSSGAGVGPAGDVYSLGAILYEMLTGRPPFQGTVHEVLQQITTRSPAAPSQYVSGLSSEIEQICLNALAKNPRHRFESMDALADALAELIERDGNPAASRRKGQRMVREPRRRKVFLLISSLLACALLASVIAIVTSLSGPETDGPGGQAVDQVTAGSRWTGTFDFRDMDYSGDVTLVVERRQGDQFSGVYSTENDQYAWKVDGTARDGNVRWEFREVIRDPNSGDLVGNASVTGKYEERRMDVVFHHTGNGSRADMVLRLAD